MDYDALLLVSFGGPEGPDDVMPFLRNVTRDRGVPEERLAAVAEHYDHFGGVSPINEQNRALLDAIGKEFVSRGLELPLYWGNRNWQPYLTDTVRQMRDAGVRRALAFVTSAYASWSACGQYLDDLGRACAEVGPGAPEIQKIRHYFDHPGFIEPTVDAVRAALATVDDPQARLVFTAHSIPLAMAEVSGKLTNAVGFRYQAQLREAARLVAQRVDPTLEWDLVWQSRSGPPQVPWLDPDVNDHLRALRQHGVPAVVVSPIGFVSDHLEVRWDLDIEAAQTAAEIGLGYARAATPSSDPRFVSMVYELVAERLDPSMQRRHLGDLPTWDHCRPGCCAVVRPSPPPDPAAPAA
jgi:protoporphyrin/coproporphyrin ferrochelatase